MAQIFGSAWAVGEKREKSGTGTQKSSFPSTLKNFASESNSRFHSREEKVWAAAQFESFFNGTWDGGKMNEGGQWWIGRSFRSFHRRFNVVKQSRGAILIPRLCNNLCTALMRAFEIGVITP